MSSIILPTDDELTDFYYSGIDSNMSQDIELDDVEDIKKAVSQFIERYIIINLNQLISDTSTCQHSEQKTQ
jgi:hypothetical protein